MNKTTIVASIIALITMGQASAADIVCQNSSTAELPVVTCQVPTTCSIISEDAYIEKTQVGTGALNCTGTINLVTKANLNKPNNIVEYIAKCKMFLDGSEDYHVYCELNGNYCFKSENGFTRNKHLMSAQTYTSNGCKDA